MLNNAISHSGAERIGILLSVNAYKVNVAIIDNGIGIFKKIQQALHLDEEYYAVLELAKGKFTTDPDSHTGEGIFFTSKAADEFLILSDGLRFVNDNKKEHRSLLQGIEDVKENSEAAGTIVLIGVLCDHSASLKDVFEEYTQMPEEYGFNKTIVPVKLLGYGEQNPYFVSRSQAKRLLMRFESFENILLDFEGIDEIGQGFADEIFRVFRNQHPNITIKVTNCSQDVMNMIYHVTGGAKL